jgi:outer membrane protein OmpA-like peptidoglycan-associated protein
MRLFYLPVLLSLLALPLQLVWSDNHTSRRPDTAEMIERLKPKPEVLDRGWPSPDDRGVKVEGGKSQAPETSSIDLEVNFEYKSAQLSTDAMLMLDRLGRALVSSELQNQRFKITGHTDAVGGAAYNLALSERRAQSVQDYLTQKHGIEGKRLEVEGKGFTQLADPANPTSAVNRRVQVTNIGY